MPELEASRTLVKSAPELWAECSDSASLARHLEAFGEIRITKLEPETAVAWEGDDVRGTVTLEPSGWGTRVVLTAVAGDAPASEARTQPPIETSADRGRPAEELIRPLPEGEPVIPVQTRSPGRLSRWLRRLGRARIESAAAVAESRRAAAAVTESRRAAVAVADPHRAATAVTDPDRATATRAGRVPAQADAHPPPPELEALTGALDSLGSAHRRPFSRA